MTKLAGLKLVDFWKRRRGVARAPQTVEGRVERPSAAVRPNVEVARLQGRFSGMNEVGSLAWPIAVAMLGDTAMGLVDTKLVASLGQDALGGVGIATTLMYVGYSIAFGTMRGVKIRVSYAVGEGRGAIARIYAGAGVVIGLCIGVVFCALTRDVGGVMHRLGVAPSTIPYGVDFLAARTFGAPAICVLAALVQYRQGLGDTRTPMVVGITGNFVNALLAYGLIHGRFGLPALGVRGAGLGTATTEWLEVAVMATLVLRERRPAEASVKSRPTLRAAIGEVCSLGLPTGAQFGAEVLAFTAFTAILGAIGAAEVAAHQVAMAVVRTSFLPGVAVAEAASILVGRALGRRYLADADRATYAALYLAVGFMSACGVVFAFGGGAIAALFTEDVAVATRVRSLLLVAAVFQALDAITIVLRGALRGAKDVRVVAFVGVACSWMFIPTAAWFFGRRLGMGAVGGWLGFIAETLVASSVFFVRWRKGGWRRDFAPIAREAEGDEPMLVEPTRVEPTRVEPTRVEPTRVEPTRVEPTRVEPTRVEPTRVEPTRVEPTRVEPTRVEPDAELA